MSDARGLGQQLKDHIVVVLAGIVVAAAGVTYAALKVTVIEPNEKESQRILHECEFQKKEAEHSLQEAVVQLRRVEQGLVEQKKETDTCKEALNRCTEAMKRCEHSELSWKLIETKRVNVDVGKCLTAGLHAVVACNRNTRNQLVYIVTRDDAQAANRVILKDLKSPPAQGVSGVLSKNNTEITIAGSARCGDDHPEELVAKIFKCQ